MSNTSMIIILICGGLITFSLRALPFALFGRKKEAPALIKKLGDLLPFAVIASLVVYCLKDIPSSALNDNIKLLAAVAAVVITHLLKKDTILSIAVGTVLYMILLHI